MAQSKTVSDKAILRAYKRGGSVKEAGRLVGMSGSSVHERLVKLGAVNQPNYWSDGDLEFLRNNYAAFSANGNVRGLAKKLRRNAKAVHLKAFRLGLGMPRGKAPKLYARVWKGMSEEEARKIMDRFKQSSLGMGQFCKRYGYDDLGFSRTMNEWFSDEWEHVIESKEPRQTMYRLGRQVEYAVRDDLRKMSYFVLRSPRSGGPTDLVALKKGASLLVQCKRSMALGVNDWNELFDLAESIGAVAVLAGRPTGRGLVYMRLTGKKDGTKAKQPMLRFWP